MLKINRKQLLVSAVIALMGGVAINALADDTITITKQEGGADSVFSLSTVNRISFSGDSVVVATATGDTKIAIADVDKIKFDIEVTAVDDITAGLGDDLTIIVANSQVTINRADGGEISTTVYNLQGQPVTAQVAQASVTIDLTSLNAGVYIIKANNKVIKVKK
jgi:hypothetical protein